MNLVKMERNAIIGMVVRGKKVVGATRSLVNAKSIQPECVNAPHEGLLVPVLMYWTTTVV